MKKLSKKKIAELQRHMDTLAYWQSLIDTKRKQFAEISAFIDLMEKQKRGVNRVLIDALPFNHAFARSADTTLTKFKVRGKEWVRVVRTHSGQTVSTRTYERPNQ